MSKQLLSMKKVLIEQLTQAHNEMSDRLQGLALAGIVFSSEEMNSFAQFSSQFRVLERTLQSSPDDVTEHVREVSALCKEMRQQRDDFGLKEKEVQLELQKEIEHISEQVNALNAYAIRIPNVEIAQEMRLLAERLEKQKILLEGLIHRRSYKEVTQIKKEISAIIDIALDIELASNSLRKRFKTVMNRYNKKVSSYAGKVDKLKEQYCCVEWYRHYHDIYPAEALKLHQLSSQVLSTQPKKKEWMPESLEEFVSELEFCSRDSKQLEAQFSALSSLENSAELAVSRILQDVNRLKAKVPQWKSLMEKLKRLLKKMPQDHANHPELEELVGHIEQLKLSQDPIKEPSKLSDVSLPISVSTAKEIERKIQAYQKEYAPLRNLLCQVNEKARHIFSVLEESNLDTKEIQKLQASLRGLWDQFHDNQNDLVSLIPIWVEVNLIQNQLGKMESDWLHQVNGNVSAHNTAVRAHHQAVQLYNKQVGELSTITDQLVEQRQKLRTVLENDNYVHLIANREAELDMVKVFEEKLPTLKSDSLDSSNIKQFPDVQAENPQTRLSRERAKLDKAVGALKDATLDANEKSKNLRWCAGTHNTQVKRILQAVRNVDHHKVQAQVTEQLVMQLRDLSRKAEEIKTSVSNRGRIGRFFSGFSDVNKKVIEEACEQVKALGELETEKVQENVKSLLILIGASEKNMTRPWYSFFYSSQNGERELKELKGELKEWNGLLQKQNQNQQEGARKLNQRKAAAQDEIQKIDGAIKYTHREFKL